jgi:hypothetical protein
VRFQEEDDDLQSVGVAVDGRGTDFAAYKVRNNRVRVSVRDGSNDEILSGFLGGPDQLLPRDAGFFSMGFHLPGDRCGDLVITGFEDKESFYGVLDGADGRLIWWRWTGEKAQHPTFTQRVDSNSAC